MDADKPGKLSRVGMRGRTGKLQGKVAKDPKGGNARWAVGKVMRGGNGRFRAEVAADRPLG